MKLAEAYGIRGMRVTERSRGDCRRCGRRASIARPVLIDFRVEQEDSVYPMVAGRRRPAQDDPAAQLRSWKPRCRRHEGRPNAEHILLVSRENKPGVLNRVASLFRRRAFNIESLTVGHTETARRLAHDHRRRHRRARRAPRRSQSLQARERAAGRGHHRRSRPIARDLAMIKVAATRDARAQVMQLVDVFRARVVDVGPNR